MNTLLITFFDRQTQRAALAELIGTFFLTLAALLAGTPYAVGLTLLIFVYVIGKLSGCHINPAVTLGLLAAGRIKLAPSVVYIIGQVLGAILARLIAGLVGNLQPEYQAAGIFAEFFGFGFLILTVLAVTHGYVPDTGSGLAIGAALTAGLLTSKGILNPAVAIAMGETLSAATWATILSGVAFAFLFPLIQSAQPASSS